MLVFFPKVVISPCGFHLDLWSLMDPLTLQMKKMWLTDENKTEQIERQFKLSEERRKKEHLLRWRPVMPALGEDQQPVVLSSLYIRFTQLGTNQVPDKDGRWHGHGCKAHRQPHNSFLGHAGSYHPIGKRHSDPNPTTLDFYSPPSASSRNNMEKTKHTSLHQWFRVHGTPV
jgi:hypothetical protein